MAEVRLVFTALALAAAMVLSGALGWRRWSGVALLALLSFVWLTVDSDWEGPTIVNFGGGHGLVLADVFGAAGLVFAAGLAVRLSRSRTASADLSEAFSNLAEILRRRS